MPLDDSSRLLSHLSPLSPLSSPLARSYRLGSLSHLPEGVWRYSSHSITLLRGIMAVVHPSLLQSHSPTLLTPLCPLSRQCPLGFSPLYPVHALQSYSLLPPPLALTSSPVDSRPYYCSTTGRALCLEELEASTSHRAVSAGVDAVSQLSGVAANRR